MTEPNGIEFHDRVPAPTGRSTTVRAGMALGAVALVVVGVVAAMGASPSPATGADPSSNPAPAATAKPDPSSAPGTMGRHGGMMPWGGIAMPGLGRDGGMAMGAFRGVTITAIDGSNVSLKTDDGWTRTIAVGSTTKITKGGVAIKVGDLAVGDQIRFSQQRASDGSYDVTAIVVVLPTIAGEVKAINGNDLTVTQLGGATATIHVNGDTTFRIDGQAGKLSDLKVGSFVVAEGTQRADGSLDAATVRGGQVGPGLRDHDQHGTPKASPAPSGTTG